MLGLSVCSAVTHCLSTQRTANTHKHTYAHKETDREPPRPPPIHRHKDPTEARHHIGTEVVNRPSEVFLQGVSSSAFIEPLSDY